MFVLIIYHYDCSLCLAIVYVLLSVPYKKILPLKTSFIPNPMITVLPEVDTPMKEVLMICGEKNMLHN